MGKKAKARLALKSASRKLGRAYRTLAAYKPPATAVAIAVVAVVAFLLGGGLYDLIHSPRVVIPRPGTIWITYPYTMLDQVLMESIISMMLWGLGFAGLFLIYESTKYADEPSRAYYRFIIGVFLLLLAYFAGRYMLYELKMKPGG
ncbi:MAG TPA: hypothetical protein ENG43_00015 [Candidatus Bathyarchaeota archaeon]|nr:MAG: hypothetical protein B6U66_04255 [Candidatus Bathyarchaeota archaeon ex4484_135]HDO81597.1 hypothetical protein [Candidatus Bathyarchaeota archaeon]HEW89709.1 hypothetical protein [Candidatus Bathyarchaeota archaeon]